MTEVANLVVYECDAYSITMNENVWNVLFTLWDDGGVFQKLYASYPDADECWDDFILHYTTKLESAWLEQHPDYAKAHNERLIDSVD